MIKKYTNLLTPEQCNTLSSKILRLYSEQQLHHTDDPGNIDFTGGAPGATDVLEVDQLLSLLQPVVEQDYDKNLEFVNSYSRVYGNSHFLKVHTDRADLDVTLSICVYNDTGVEWPMYVSEYLMHPVWSGNTTDEELRQIHDRAKPYTTAVGDALVCYGTRNPHWREPLTCESDKKIVQVFYHWRIV